MKYIIYILIFFTFYFVIFFIWNLVFYKKRRIKDSLSNIKRMYSTTEEETILSKPFQDRIIKPAYQKFTGFIGRITPKGIYTSIEKYIFYSGTQNNFTFNRILAIQMMLSIIFPGIFYILTSLTGGKTNIILLVLGSVFGFLLPVYILRSKARKRQTMIQNALPDMLDLLFVSVEAGLGFDMALKRTTEKMPGPLSDEMNRALDEINRGKTREDALRQVAKRTGVEDLTSFITAVIQSEQLGSNIANMLRIQSTSMRQRRRQRAEELAMKVPVKMLFPLVFFMFPALIVVILGPAIIRIVETFKTMF